MANKVKLNGVRPEVIKLQLFPFSLRDVASTWFESLLMGSVNTWKELVEPYMSREKRRNNCLQAGGRGESLQHMEKI